MIDLPMYDPMHWQNDARCFQLRTDPAVMQPEKATRQEVEDAKAICGTCPVADRCRIHAESQEPSAYGVHAGQWFGDEPTWLVEQSCACCGKVRRVRERYADAEWFCTRACSARGARVVA